MGIAFDTIRKNPGYSLHIVKTAQYKTNTLVFKMKAPLKSETATYRSLLPYILQSNTATYKTTPSLRSYLDELYGASFYVDVAKKGEYQVISFIFEIANEKFLHDSEPLLEKGIAFLADVLFNPKMDGESFDVATFNNEKRSLQQRIQSIYDDKMRYATTRLVEVMCEEEPYGIDALGDIESLDSITAESLYSYYKQALAQDEMDVYVIGDINEIEVQKLFNQHFKLPNREPARMKSVQKKVNEVKEKIEEMDVKQGKLNIGYRTHIVYGDPDYYALQVFNGIFGGFSHSKLFINVREKASLAYYAASRLESHKGLLMVMSGIESANYDQAVDIIHEQMKEMKQGNFSDEELSQTKAVIKNQLLETVDSARGLVEILYHNVISGYAISLEEWLKKTESVTKEEIVDVAKKIELDTIYFMKGTEV